MNTYKLEMIQTSTIQKKYIGSREFLDNLTYQGIKNPEVIRKESFNEFSMNTGDFDQDSLFPIELKVERINNTDDMESLPEGTIIYGNCSLGESPKMDSVYSKYLDEESKETVIESLSGFFSHMSFENKELKIGESFTKTIPFTVPISNILFIAKIIATYTLISISDGTATFKISETLESKKKYTTMHIKMIGKGDGTLKYDINNSYYKNYQLNMNVDITIKQTEYTIKVHSIVNTEQNIEIANK